MAIHSLARRTTNVTGSNAATEFIAGATHRAKVVEAGIIMAAATASVFMIGRPAAAGVTPTAPVLLLPEDIGDSAPECKTALAWGTSPTDPTAAFRRPNLPATIGAGIIFTFPRGIMLAVNGTLVIQNVGTTGVVDCHLVADE
jgi:hypothetical protein